MGLQRDDRDACGHLFNPGQDQFRCALNMARRFFRSTIQELETAFKKYRPDVSFLRDLLDELSHRTTDRAVKLRIAAQTQLRKLSAVESSPPSQPSPQPPGEPTPRDNSNKRQERITNSSSSPTLPQPEYADTIPPPPVTNEPEQILSSWIALEVLSPPT